MAKKGLLRRADYSFGPGTSPAAGAALSALTTLTVTAPVHEFTHVNSVWGLVGGVAIGGAAVVAVGASKRLRLNEGAVMCYRAACWLSAGMWSWWELAHDPWSWNGVMALGVGAAAAAVAGSVLRHAEDKEIGAGMDEAAAHLAALAGAEPTPDQIAARWVALILKVTRIAVTIPAVKRWADKTGYTLECELPLDGTTIDDIKPHEQALATAAGLKPGCNVMVTDAGADAPRNVVLLRVNQVNEMAKDQAIPRDWEPRTINNPIPVGVVADGTVATADLRENCMVLAGQSGSGKSTALNVVIKGAVQCVDNVVVMIDTKGGGEAARRWVRAWYEDRAPSRRPALLLVANTNELAILMMAGLINIVDGRPKYYAELMHQQGADKIMPTPALPQITLIIDEFKSLPEIVKDGVEYIADKGRSAAVREVVSTLDPTAAGIPRVIIKQCRERYAVRVSDEADLHHLFDGGGAWLQRFDVRSMTHPGMGFLSSNAQTPYQIKGWWQDMEVIDETSIALSASTPNLDQPSIDMFDTVRLPGKYGEEDTVITGLWKKFWPMTLEAMFPDKPSGTPSLPAAPTASPAAQTQPAPDMGTSLATLGDAMSDMDAARKRMEAACAAADAEQDQGAEEPTGPVDSRPGIEPNPEFDALVNGGDVMVTQPRDRYRDLLRELGTTGATDISSRMRRDGYKTSRQTVQGWLAEDEATGKVIRTDEGWKWIGPL